jgi:hypothetical protein
MVSATIGLVVAVMMVIVVMLAVMVELAAAVAVLARVAEVLEVEVPEMQVLQGHLEIQHGAELEEPILAVVEDRVQMEAVALLQVAVKADQESL